MIIVSLQISMLVRRPRLHWRKKLTSNSWLSVTKDCHLSLIAMSSLGQQKGIYYVLRSHLRLKQTETQIYYTCPIRISGLLNCYNTEESVWRISHGLSLSSFMSFHDPMDCSPPGSSVHGISQARIMEWVAFSKRFFPNPGIKPPSPVSPAVKVDSLLLSHLVAYLILILFWKWNL